MAQTSSRRRAFDYKPPTYDEAKALSERKGRGFDGLFVENTKFFKAKDGDNEIRILPPTWEGARHYSFEVKLHRDIGADKQTYLCLDQDGSPEPGRCPICAERRLLSQQRASQKELDELRAQSSNVIYLIDRNKKDEGPMVWMISGRTDNEILAQSLIKRTQQYLPIAHPIDGYDVEFNRTGTGRGTKYQGFKVARTESPVTDDPDQLEEWMEFIETHPIPEILRFYEADRIRVVFRGEVEAGGDGDEPAAPDQIRHRTRPDANGNAGDEDRGGDDGGQAFDGGRPINGNGAAAETSAEREPPPAEPVRPSQRSRIDEPAAPTPPAGAAADAGSLKDRLRARLQARNP
jgi:hypothetical protein